MSTLQYSSTKGFQVDGYDGTDSATVGVIFTARRMDPLLYYTR